jgi:uncharacterized protein (DUF58 family)
MGASAYIALIVIVAGALLGAGGLLFAGLLMGMVLALRSVWSRYGLRSLEYERHVSAHRVLWGERIDLDLVVRNGKPLPLPWLQIDDTITHGAEIVGRKLTHSSQRGFDVLRETWSIGWFERVTRRLQIVGTRRGSYRFISAELRVADLFARTHRSEERALSTSYRVVPRIVTVRSAVTNSPLGSVKATKGPYEEPSLFAGVRPYQPGDQLRRVHWKATARLGVPVSRRYDPAREREVLIAVDMQTIPGVSWMLNWNDDLVEGLCVAALSLARSFVGDGIAVGLAVNAFSDRPQRTVFLPPSAAGGQITVMADLLADVSQFASVPFNRLLADVARRAPLGCSIIALSGRDPVEFVPTLRRIRAQGYGATLAAFGPDAARWSARARSLGVPSAGYRLDPDWRTADALERIA